jgi:hypothetical protein
VETEVTARWRRKIRTALVNVERYDAALTEAVKAARGSGATWQDIAEELGTTPQAAHARFAKRLKNDGPTPAA